MCATSFEITLSFFIRYKVHVLPFEGKTERKWKRKGEVQENSLNLSLRKAFSIAHAFKVIAHLLCISERKTKFFRKLLCISYFFMNGFLMKKSFWNTLVFDESTAFLIFYGIIKQFLPLFVCHTSFSTFHCQKFILEILAILVCIFRMVLIKLTIKLKKKNNNAYYQYFRLNKKWYLFHGWTIELLSPDCHSAFRNWNPPEIH